MKVRVEIIDPSDDDEIVIRTSKHTPQIAELVKKLQEDVSGVQGIKGYKRGVEYYIDVDSILFFESEEDAVYAHTEKEMYQIKQRLYEIETEFAFIFVRISKSAIVNFNEILSIQRNLASASLISFRQSYKQVYVSRHYYKQLQGRLDERRHRYSYEK